MAFQLFNANIGQDALAGGITKFSEGIKQAQEKAEQYKTDAKAMDALAKIHPEIAQALGYDELGQSPMQKSQALRGAMEMFQVGKQITEQRHQEERIRQLQLENKATEYLQRELLKRDGTGMTNLSPAAQAIVDKNRALYEQKKEMEDLGMDSDYEEFKSAYLAATKKSAEAKKFAEKKAAEEAKWPTSIAGMATDALFGGMRTPYGRVGDLTTLGKVMPKNQFPEMTEDDKKNILKLHKVNSDPDLAQYYMQRLRAEQSAIPNISIPEQQEKMDIARRVTKAGNVSITETAKKTL